jgi:hypothetical protein
MIQTSYKNAYKEVYTILSYLDEEEYEKIPLEIIDAIKSNMNEDYDYEINDEFDLMNQQMLPETKATLFNLFRDYLSTPEQKEKIMRMQDEDRQKIELKKKQQYNVDIFKNNTTISNTEQVSKKLEIIAYEENILKRIFNKIKKFLHIA